MILKVGMVVTVNLDDKEHQFLLVHADGDGKEMLSLKAPLVKFLNTLAIGDQRWWQVAVLGGALMQVELVKVEAAT